MFGVIAIAALISVAWFSGQGTILTIFEHLNALQEMPPIWLAVPMVTGEYLLFWAVFLMLIVLAITKLSPTPQPWSRALVVGILIVLSVRYVLWRSLSTLNLSNPLTGVFSLGLFFLELLILGSGMIQLVLLLRVKDRRSEADRLSVAVCDRTFTPSVDILIPTYNEPPFILRRTIIGCQTLDYEAKTIYLLDDKRRPEAKALAEELGCQYLARPDNLHAKAGNLNHALAHTHGELIAVFDADFIPTKNFLTRTVGFFQTPLVGLVQTPQTFYNADPIARNLGLEDVLTPEEEVFYRQIQPIRDAAEGVICAGTSFVVRRSALVDAGCFFTGALSEDYYTGIRLAAKGYRLIYLNEKLSAGLAAENISAQALQRLRWARGTLQAFFVNANPLTIAGLRPIQRLAHLEGIWHWFTSISRVGFLLFPLAYSFLGIIPLRATMAELLYYFLPYYLVQLTTFSWLNHRSRSALLSDLYTLVLAFPLAITVLQVMSNPFGQEFRVTPKGTVSDRFRFNWRLAFPLIIMFGLTAISLWTNLGYTLLFGSDELMMTAERTDQMRGLNLGWIWSAYNLLTLGIALLILIDAPSPYSYDWFNLHRTVKLTVGEQTVWGFTTKISEVGAEVALTQAEFPLTSDAVLLDMSIVENDLTMQGHVIHREFKGAFPTVRIQFEPLPLGQERRLIEMLFCRPGQWQSRCAPGEMRSLWLLLKVLLTPRVLFDRKAEIRAVSVSQV
ncbi:glycosyltransferase [Myxacorys almedinensis A]|uniref:cellulose synthase (UDP-forming) n=2 Tax=Myxacorys TaxID=2056239 RepID=A0A8J7Z3Q7_9CYAN|nr:glycosyltransferase [Myxacorys almedinensis]NDJ15928.1 glycosyltransferase [Myxacorys almedinensis A]